MTDQPLTILAIESSTSACSVALRRHGSLCAEYTVSGRGQAEALIPAIAEVLAAARLDWPEIDLIAVTVGPGSFTGLRIGLAAARGVALARHLQIVGVTTADLLAHMVPPENFAGRTLLVAIDSKRADLFVQPFGAGHQPLAEIRALTPAQALGWQNRPLLISGDAAQQFQGLRDDVEIAVCLPAAASLAALAEIRHRAGQGLPPQPLYLRPPDVSLPKAGR